MRQRSLRYTLNVRVLSYWIPPILWSAGILAASGPTFAADQTGGWLRAILVAIYGSVPDESTLLLLHFGIRKLAHLTEYAVLGMLLFRAIRGDSAGWRLPWSLLAVILALVVAASDEGLQSLRPKRTGSLADLVIDGAGATIAQIFCRRRIVSDRGLLFSTL